MFANKTSKMIDDKKSQFENQLKLLFIDNRIEPPNMEALVAEFSQKVFHPFEERRKANMVDSSTQTEWLSFPKETDFTMAAHSLNQILIEQDKLL